MDQLAQLMEMMQAKTGQSGNNENPMMMLQQLMAQVQQQSQTIGTRSDKESMDHMVQQLDRAKELYDSVQKRKGTRPRPISPYQLLMSHRHGLANNFKDADKPNRIINTTLFDVYHSEVTNPLGELKPMFIEDMLLETWHRGRYLLCRTVEDPCRLSGVMTIVEDARGTLARLSVYNWVVTFEITGTPEGCGLPKGSLLLIKEPYYKESSGGGPQIRCDSPSDVVFIEYLDANYQKLLDDGKISKVWDRACADRDKVYAAPRPQSPLTS